MGMLLVAVTATVLIGAIFITGKASFIFEKLQGFLDRINVVLRENITGVRVIRAFNKESYEESRMRRSFEDYAESAIQANRLFFGLESLAIFVLNICIVGILWIGGNRIGVGRMKIGDLTALTEYAVLILFYVMMAQMVNRMGQVCVAVFASRLLINGTLSVGAFQAFFQYINQASEPLTEAAYIINSMQSALASAERVYGLLDEPEMTADTGNGSSREDSSALLAARSAFCISRKNPIREPVHKKIPRAAGQVEFHNVCFDYDTDKELIKNVSFTAKPGQKIAIVGATGAGKTTLINLLMRFYEVNSGKILLDGVDTASMTREVLRSHFGMVLQDTWLFGSTIADNIAYGKPDATMEEIVAAAKAARVDFFVRTMPKGYQTVLGNDSENISVGQRQLLTIARVVLCNPSVLILDEATSSVDTRTEIEINKAMKALMSRRTSFVIAHRLSTIVDADLILVMENGNIIEQGSHAQLLRTGGAYAQLYNSQFAV